MDFSFLCVVFLELAAFPLARAKRLKKGGKLNIFLSLLDARLHKRFHRRLHQTWTVETTGSVFVAIKLPRPKKYIYVYSIRLILINVNELRNQVYSQRKTES